MTAFQNAIDLRLAVSDHVNNRGISDVFPRLIEMAEADLNAKLRTRHQLVDATLTLDAGVSPLPPDFLEVSAFVGRHGRHCSPRYSVDGFNLTIPGYSGDICLQYYASLPSLACSPTSTNWLLAKFPTVYLYGVALQAAKHLRDVDVAQATDQLYAFALGNLIKDDERARWAAQDVRVCGPTP